MPTPGSVRVTVMVAVEPAVAFEIFTEETEAWYRPKGGVLRFNAEAGTVTTRGGTTGRITVWEAGRRLVFVDQKGTEVDVTFEAVGSGTKVMLEHRGLDRLSPDDALSVVQYGWRRLAFQFETYVKEQT